MSEIKFDKETMKWFKKHPRSQSTVKMCKRCGFFYKPSLEEFHNCEDCLNDKRKG